MKYLVNDFGDGCCIEIGNHGALIDFGSQQSKATIRSGGFLSKNYWDTFIVSHYHTDHYNVLYELKNKTIKINNLIFPHIPKLVDEPVCKDISLEGMLYFYNMLTVFDKFGIPSCGLIELLKEKNDGPFSWQRAKCGDKIIIQNNVYEVVWPPETVPPGNTLKSLVNKIQKIEDIIETDEILKELWEEFEVNYPRKQDEDKNFDEKVCSSNMFEVYQRMQKKESISLAKEKLSKNIRDITNELSICLYKYNTFLFLGDLEKEEIKICINLLKEKYFLNHVSYLIAPHHGTHWENRLFDIYAKNLIVSNGKIMNRYFKENFKRITDNLLHTYLCGNIYFDDEF